MPEVIRFAKGTASEHLNFTSENGEITLICDDTPNRKVTGVIRLHDGETVGGIPFGGSQLLNDMHDVNAANTIEFQVMTVDANGQFYFANTIQTEKLDVNGEITQPINAFIGSNIYYDGGWKYCGNGTGGILKLADGQGIVFSTTTYNAYGEGAAATPSEHMRINISGNVGIGTSNPQGKVHISSDTSSTVVALSNNFGFSQLRQAANSLFISNADTLGSIVFQTNNGAERMRIDSSGNVGINTIPNTGFITGNKFEVNAGSLGTTAGNISSAVLLTANDGNQTTLQTFNYRVNNGTGHNNTEWRTQRIVDITRQGYVSYGSDYIAIGTSNAERMRIDVSGNVGIGTSSPSYKLHVFSGSATATVAKFFATNYGNLGTTYIELGTEYGDGGSRIGNINPTSNYGTLVFETMTNTSGIFAERMRIDSSGNILFGNNGNIGFIGASGGDVLRLYQNRNATTPWFYFNTSGGYGVYSDARLKENIISLSKEDATNLIKNINPVEFNWKSDSGDNTKRISGVLAQDVLAYATTEGQKNILTHWETFDESDPDCPHMGLSDHRLIPSIIGTIQHLLDELDEKTSQIDALTARIETLESNTTP